jgi:hypothetical protein
MRGPCAPFFDNGRKGGTRQQDAPAVSAVLHGMGIVKLCRGERLAAHRAVHTPLAIAEDLDPVVTGRFGEVKRAAVFAEKVSARGEQLHRTAAIPAVHGA